MFVLDCVIIQQYLCLKSDNLLVSYFRIYILYTINNIYIHCQLVNLLVIKVTQINKFYTQLMTFFNITPRMY